MPRIKTKQAPIPLKTVAPADTPQKPSTPRGFGRRILEYARKIPFLHRLLNNKKNTPLSKRTVKPHTDRQPGAELQPAKRVKDISPEYLGIVRQPPSVRDVEKGEHIAKGSYGSVHHALRKERKPSELAETPVHLDRAYVVKEQRFGTNNMRLKEIQAELRHQGAATAAPKIGGQRIDHFTKTHKVVMEHGGASVAALLGKGGKLPEHQARDICHSMLLQLKELHYKGIVHRDIKPDNTLINHQGKVTIVDYGLALKGRPTPERQFTDFGGTPRYMCPEIAAGEVYSHNADLWSLGITLYVMLTDSKPVLYQNMFGRFILDKQAHKDLITTIEDHPEWAPDTKELLKSLLTIDPQKRPTITEALKLPVFTQHNDITKLSFTELQTRHLSTGKQIAALEQEREELETPKTKGTVKNREQKLATLNAKITRLGAAAGALQDQLAIRELDSQISILLAEGHKEQERQATLSGIIKTTPPDSSQYQKAEAWQKDSRERAEEIRKLVSPLLDELKVLQDKARKMPD